MDMSMIDATNGGALVDKTLVKARNLIANMATNSQQLEVKQETKQVNEVDTCDLKQQLANLTHCVKTLATSVTSIIKPHGICSL